MYAALSSHRGCSQVLFLETLTGHVHSMTLRSQRGVAAGTCLRRFGHKERLFHRRESDGNINKVKLFPILLIIQFRYVLNKAGYLGFKARPSGGSGKVFCAFSQA